MCKSCGKYHHRKNYPYSITTSTADISYLYNAADLRIFKYVETATDTLTEYYLRNSSGQELGIYTADGDSTWAWYVYGSERIAKIVPEDNQLPEYTTPFGYNSDYTFYVREDDTLYHTEYYFTDHLGNTRITYLGEADNESITRNISYMADYYPFGKTLREYAAGTEERYQFISKEKDQETQYNYLDARLYDGDLARMLGVDVMAGIAPHWTPYRYGFDNPISFVDPSGMFEDEYKVDVDGYIKKTKDTDDDFDVLYNVDQTGAIQVEKGILDQIENTKISGSEEFYKTIKIRGDYEAKSFFEFVAKNSFVEWTRYALGKKGNNGLNYITTSHQEKHEFGAKELYNSKINRGYTIREISHNHPFNTAYPSGIDDDGKRKAGEYGDISFSRQLTEYYKYFYPHRRTPTFLIFRPKQNMYIKYGPYSTKEEINEQLK